MKTEKVKKVEKAPPKVEKKPEEDDDDTPKPWSWIDARGVCEKRVCE